MLTQHKELFESIKIGECEIKNRYVMAPMGLFGLVDTDGILTNDGIEYFVERARGGTGLLITGTCMVMEEFEGILAVTLFCSKRTNKWLAKQQFTKLTEQVHAYGSKIFLQLSAGFGRVAMAPHIVKNSIAPSVVENRYNPEIIHREMTTAEVEEYIQAFGDAAAFAKQFGFDGVEIHAVHEGYLLDQFATECFNQRTDRFGGSFENRYRFATEVVEIIKETCGTSFPVSLRYSPKHYMKAPRVGGLDGEDFVEMGRDMPEGLEGAKLLTAAGYDALNVDCGCYDSHYWSHPGVFQKDGLYLDAAAQVKAVVDVPVIVAGRMDNPDFGAQSIREGKCDMIGIGRPSLADPYLPNKVREGQAERVRPCISCNYGCLNLVFGTAGRLSCAVNAQSCSELTNKFVPADQKKKILVIGGGPAGTECARVSAMRGHDVTLIEKRDRLGGELLSASRASFKKHDMQLADWFVNELNLLGVDVKLNTTATKESILNEKADVVVMALGAKPCIPNIKGKEGDNVYVATDILYDITKAGKNVVIIGAGQIGVETGIWLLEEGRNVTVVEATDKFMPAGLHSDIENAKLLMKFYKGEVLLSTEVLEISEAGVRIKKAAEESLLVADTVILATGYRKENTLYKELESEINSIYNIGDSAVARNIYYAIHEGYLLAKTL